MLVTSVTKHRRKLFADPAVARMAIETLFHIQEYYAFFLHGFVVMPDHVHLVMYPPEGASVSKIMQIWKRAVSFNLGRGPMWQSRFHIRYLHYPQGALRYVDRNPVVAGFVDEPGQYRWSSASGRWDILPLDRT